MTQGTAPMSPAIKIVTGGVLVMLAVILATSLTAWPMLVGAALLGAVVLGCYLRAPVAYDLTGDQLTVRFRLGEKVFTPVTRCSLLSARPPWGLRLWGNGGLFAAAGIFWNKAYGVYRAYVTSARYTDFVLVETPIRKILISPEKPAEFVRACTNEP
jgi:Bacterial PH domain